MAKPVNVPPGLRLEETEVNFLKSLLMACAEQAQSENNPKVYNISLGLSQRISQAEMHAQGVPPELQASLQDGLRRASESKSPERARRAMENFLATMIRLHPDPARVLSQYVLSYIEATLSENLSMAGEQAASNAACAILDMIDVKLAALIAEYNADGYPDGDELLAYIAAWTAAGKQHIEAGREPWEGDDHIDRARQLPSGETE